MELGKFGVWFGQGSVTGAAAAEIEELGYGTLWVGGSPAESLEAVEPLLAATTAVTVGTSIVNIWTAAPDRIAESFYRLDAAYPGRFVLGIGAGHPEHDTTYRAPYDALVDYLDQLDALGVPAERRMLAALGPRVLRLARDRTAGPLPYLVTPEHTRQARDIVGDAAIIATEHKAVLHDDAEHAREVARPTVEFYLTLNNYVANLRRIGFAEQDLVSPATNTFIDALTAHGSATDVAAQLTAHLTAGANHVAIQPIAADGDILPTLRTLAPHLG